MTTREDARKAVPDFEARVAALRRFTKSGPEFERRVRDELADAYCAWEPMFVGARLVTAEIAAGLRSEEDYQGRFETAVWSRSPESAGQR